MDMTLITSISNHRFRHYRTDQQPYEGAKMNEAAFKALVRAAVALNKTKSEG